MPSNVFLKASGLNTSPNQLAAPEGALAIATNVILRRDNVIESRRGYKLYGDAMTTSVDRAKQLLVYKERIIRHFGTTLQYDTQVLNSVDESEFDSFSGSYSEPDPGRRIRFIESNGNLYFTTADGIKKLSAKTASDFTTASSFITQAGGIKAIDAQASVKITNGGQNGFLAQDSVVAYRHVWAIKDANNNLVQGAPSERTQISLPLLTLLLNDLNNVLGALDDINQSTSLITDGNYMSTLGLTSSSTSQDLQTNLLALTTKLDTDIDYTSGAVNTASHKRITTNSGRVIFNTDMSTYIAVSDKITFSGFTGTGGSEFNGNIGTVTSVSTTTVTFTVATAFTGTDGGDIADTGGTVNSYNYRTILQPAVPSIPTTDAELVALQTYVDSIIARLQVELTGVIPSTLMTTYIDVLDITTTATVLYKVNIPQGINSNYFLQIYRTEVTSATGTDKVENLSAGDEESLAYEAYPTTAELSAKEMLVEDIVLDGFLGAYLYTNSTTGEGIGQSNDVPPLAKDINRFKNVIFFANTQTRQRKQLNLLGVANMIEDYNNSITPTITITTSSSQVNKYSFVTSLQEITNLTFVAESAGNYTGKYFTLNGGNDYTSTLSDGTAYNPGQYYVWYYVNGSGTDPAVSGKTGIRVTINSGETANNVATKTKNSINRVITDFLAVDNALPTITVTNIVAGYCSDATNGNLGANVTVSIFQQGRGENVSNKEILLSTLASVGQAVEETSRSLARVLNKTTGEVVYGYYSSGAKDVPGKMFIEARSLATSEFYILGNNSTTGASFSPDISGTKTISSSGTGSTVVVTTSTSHGFSDGDTVVISNSNSTPVIDGVYSITETTSTTFKITPVATVTVAATSGVVINATDSVFSENETQPHRIYYSKLQQPEAVPIANYFDVGAQDKQILRIFPLRDSLFVFKEDGLFRISGEVAPFSVSLFDSSVICIAPDSVDTSNNMVYAWTTQGINSVSESGASIISRAIDVDILKRSSSSYTNFGTVTFGVGYESDNSYLVWTTDKPTDTVGTICYRYSTLTNTWTTFDKTNTCAVVNPTDDKMYLGAGDVRYIEQERKSFARTDYADREYHLDLTLNNYLNNGSTIKVTSVSNLNIGDVLYQEQYVTVSEFNALLLKLDTDTGVTDTDYYSLLEASGGSGISDKLKNTLVTKGLAAKLDADPGVNDTNYLSTISLKSGSITGNTVAGATVITTSAAHGLFSGRIVNISSSNSTPSIDGKYAVTVISPTTFSIPVRVTSSGSTGQFETLDNNFLDIKACYNKIVSKLNADLGVNFGNYKSNNTTSEYEAVITDISQSLKTLTVNVQLPLILGPITVFNRINSLLTYVPVTMGDPLSFKQIYEATMMFENKQFTSAVLSFASDLLPRYTDISFDGDGPGTFGSNAFGDTFFGGGSNSAPFRTIVPRDAQRCRFLSIKFNHKVAREKYSIFGISLTGNPYSTRAYR